MSWEGEPFPVYLVILDAADAKAHGLYLRPGLRCDAISAEIMATDSIEVRIPGAELDKDAIKRWREDKNAVLAQLKAIRDA